MSDLFDDDPRDEPARRSAAGRSRALVITAVVLLASRFIGLTAFASFWTERLWFTSRRLPAGSSARCCGRGSASSSSSAR